MSREARERKDGSPDAAASVAAMGSVTRGDFAVGIDLIEPERIQHAVERWGEKFLDRIFTPEERSYCDRMANPWFHYAARFAAKEAFSKALGTGMRGLRWRDVAIIREESGQPILRINWPAGHEPRAATVSLSHTRTMAGAVVVLAPLGAAAAPGSPHASDVLRATGSPGMPPSE